MARREVGTPKNKKARFQVIPRELAQELREWMLKTDGQLLFPGVRGGPLPNNSINRMYRRLADEAFFEGVGVIILAPAPEPRDSLHQVKTLQSAFFVYTKTQLVL